MNSCHQSFSPVGHGRCSGQGVLFGEETHRPHGSVELNQVFSIILLKYERDKWIKDAVEEIEYKVE